MISAPHVCSNKGLTRAQTALRPHTGNIYISARCLSIFLQISRIFFPSFSMENNKMIPARPVWLTVWHIFNDFQWCASRTCVMRKWVIDWDFMSQLLYNVYSHMWCSTVWWRLKELIYSGKVFYNVRAVFLYIYFIGDRRGCVTETWLNKWYNWVSCFLYLKINVIIWHFPYLGALS